jgi:DNA-binding transcriptional LysR family regulator
LDLPAGCLRRFTTRGVERLYEDEYVVCASTAHPLAGRKAVSVADVAGERCALSEPTLFAPHRLSDKFREHGLPPPNIVFRSRSPALRLRVVACSNLLDLNCRSFLERARRELPVTALPVKELTWPNSVGIICRRETYRSLALRRFVDVVKETAKDIVR